MLSVADTGFGIAPELLPSIFDMFVQGERTLDRAQGGLGIGLTLVRRLVELHGGTVIASSGGAGRGSTFTVRLPQVHEAIAAGNVSTSFDRAAPKRVLLIEDNRDARELFRLVRELAGHSVYEAENGDRGLELLKTERPHAAIIDIGLPGLPFARVTRKAALTGYWEGVSSTSCSAARVTGFTRYRSKPDVRACSRPGCSPISVNAISRICCNCGCWCSSRARS